MVYTVTFNPALDYVVRVGTLRDGNINRAESEDVQFGGKGINVSAVLRNLGVDNVALGFVAGFTGQALEQGLLKNGIHTNFIRLDDGLTRINIKIKAERETEINGRGILTVVDAARNLLCNVLPYQPFLIKPNNLELGEIFGRTLESDEDIAECAHLLQEQGARNVLVSMAGNGSLLLDETGGCHRLGVPKGKVRNSVGAGDSMVAGFLAGWLKEHDYRAAHRMGAAAGAATAFSDGLATGPEILALLNAF